MGEQVTIDIEALKNFQGTLAGRLQQVDQLQAHLTEIGHNAPSFGSFSEANTANAWYTRLHQEHLSKVVRLRQAILAAQDATNSIIANYATNEAAARASMDELNNLLSPITSALGGTDV